VRIADHFFDLCSTFLGSGTAYIRVGTCNEGEKKNGMVDKEKKSENLCISQ